MFKTNFIKAGVAIAAVAGIASMGVISTAQADPSSTPRTYNGGGSDTIQDVMNDISNGPGSALSIGSWDVTGGLLNITGTSFNRPVGSGQGVRSLSSAISSNPSCVDPFGQDLASGDLQFARSSSGPSVAGSLLTYIPFARDAVSVAYKPASGSGLTSVSFSRAQLKGIYGGPSLNPAGSGVTYAVGTGLPIVGGVTLHPYLPQSGSGTLSFFLGNTAAGVSPVASYVLQSSAYLENRGWVLTGHDLNADGDYVDAGELPPAPDNSLIPFSAAQWIYQQRTGGATDTTGGLLIANLDEDNNSLTTDRTAVTGSGSSAAPGTLYGSLSAPPTASDPFARDTYNVIDTSLKGSGTVDAALIAAAGVGVGPTATAIRNKIAADGFGVINAYAGTEATYLYPTGGFTC